MNKIQAWSPPRLLLQNKETRRKMCSAQINFCLTGCRRVVARANSDQWNAINCNTFLLHCAPPTHPNFVIHTLTLTTLRESERAKPNSKQNRGKTPPRENRTVAIKVWHFRFDCYRERCAIDRFGRLHVNQARASYRDHDRSSWPKSTRTHTVSSGFLPSKLPKPLRFIHQTSRYAPTVKRDRKCQTRRAFRIVVSPQTRSLLLCLCVLHTPRATKN